MKKNIVLIIVIFIAGVITGWYMFGRDDDKEKTDKIEEKVSTYTCPMHPQIRQEGFGTCPICGMDLVVVDESDGELLTEIHMSETAVRLAQLRTIKVSSQIPSKELHLNGRVETDERRVNTQTAHFSGRIEKLYVTFTGEYVRRGQLLATVYSPELISAQRELLEALKQKETNPTFLRAVRQKLKQWKLSDKQIEQIESSGKVQTEINLHADVSGVVLRRHVSSGDYFSTGTLLFEISDLSKVWVVFEAYEDDLLWVSVGDTIEFSVRDKAGKKMSAKVEFVDPYVDEKTRIARIRLSMDNVSGQFRPGMFVNGMIKSKLDQYGKMITIPKTAVLWGGKTSVVYVKKPDVEETVFEFREVVLGEHLGDSYIILDGLKEGEEIAVHGTFSIDAAAQLAGKLSLMGRHLLLLDDDKEVDEFLIEIGDFSESTPEKFKEQLSNLFKSYLLLSKALIETDFTVALTKLNDVEKGLTATDMSLLKGDAHLLWMTHLDMMKNSIDEMKKAKEVEEIRYHFQPFSDALAASIESFGIKDVKVYHQYCPMAFDDKGAWWLSDTNLIENPYFGDIMLRCGIVDDRFKK